MAQVSEDNINQNLTTFIDDHVTTFVTDMKQNKVIGSFDIAIRTVLLLRKLVGNTRWSTAKELIDSVKTVGQKLIDSQSSETSVGNMVRRILKLVREEYSGTVGKEHEG